jgi:hypothetical protein
LSGKNINQFSREIVPFVETIYIRIATVCRELLLTMLRQNLGVSIMRVANTATSNERVGQQQGQTLCCNEHLKG